MIVVVKLSPEEAIKEVVDWASVYYTNPNVNAVITTPEKFYNDFIKECEMGGYAPTTFCMKMINYAKEVLVGHYDETGGIGTKLKHFIRDNFDKIKEKICF